MEAGFFHGEITSQEADQRLKDDGRVGGFLVRMRKGSRHQIALAFTDAQNSCKHILLDVKNNKYSVHQLPQQFDVCHLYSCPLGMLL